MTDDVMKRSVTKDDSQKVQSNDGGFTVVLGPSSIGSWLGGGGLLQGVAGANGLPEYGTKAADMILSESVMIEDMWASAVSTAISKQTALGFEIEDTTESKRRIKQAQELMLNFDGNYTAGLGKVLRDYLTTDNGGFIEVVRSSSAAGSKVIGLMHLDSLRCYRTGDPKYPVVYIDLKGYHHVMRAEDVLMFADTPSSRTLHYGMGYSAARRAFNTILKLTAIETFVREKISGARNLAIHIVNGITSDQLGQALSSSAAMQDQKGYVVYRGSTIIPMIRNETPSIATIPLAEIPDGFNAEAERRDAYLRYANALGIFVGEIQPLTGQGLGTGTQSVVLEEAAEGRGLASFRKQFALAITHQVMPDAVTFYVAASDQKDKRDRAQTLQAWANALKPLIDSQVISPVQGLNVLVDEGYMPREFLATDSTAGGVVTDTENVENAAQATEIAARAQIEANGQIPTDTQIASTQATTEAEKAIVRLKQAASAYMDDAPLFDTGTPPASPEPSTVLVDDMIADELTSALRLLERITR